MISGIDLNEVVDHICKNDKENPTTWRIRALPSRKLAQITGTANEQNQMDRMIDLVKYGLCGWKNFKFKDKDVELELDTDGSLSPGVLDMIPFNVIVELSTAILKINKLSAEEIKN